MGISTYRRPYYDYYLSNSLPVLPVLLATHVLLKADSPWLWCPAWAEGGLTPPAYSVLYFAPFTCSLIALLTHLPLL